MRDLTNSRRALKEVSGVESLWNDVQSFTVQPIVLLVISIASVKCSKNQNQIRHLNEFNRNKTLWFKVGFSIYLPQKCRSVRESSAMIVESINVNRIKSIRVSVLFDRTKEAEG